MPDREKTIKGLEKLREDLGYGLPDRSNVVMEYLNSLTDAITLLKEQEPRVMTLDELTEIYVEFKGDNCPIRLTNFDLQKIVKHMVDGVCRLWTSKPTDKQRKAVKWDEI